LDGLPNPNPTGLPRFPPGFPKLEKDPSLGDPEPNKDAGVLPEPNEGVFEMNGFLSVAKAVGGCGEVPNEFFIIESFVSASLSGEDDMGPNTKGDFSFSLVPKGESDSVLEVVWDPNTEGGFDVEVEDVLEKFPPKKGEDVGFEVEVGLNVNPRPDEVVDEPGVNPPVAGVDADGPLPNVDHGEDEDRGGAGIELGGGGLAGAGDPRAGFGFCAPS
jgi:hypothetical protein